jgi:hypothetical protein
MIVVASWNNVLGFMYIPANVGECKACEPQASSPVGITLAVGSILKESQIFGTKMQKCKE